MKRSNSLLRSWRWGLASLCLALSSCSTYQVQKLGTTPDNKLVEPNGIPFMLVRPEYTLSRAAPAEGEKKATYTIAVSYETDSAQAYTLRIKPGAFADAAFVMKLGSNGTLSGTSTTLSEQVTPAITALGSFSASLIGAMATKAFDVDSVRSEIYRSMEKQATCDAMSDAPVAPVPDAAGVLPQQLTVAGGIKVQGNSFKDDAEFTSLFHYLTEKEKSCLTSARTVVQSRVNDKLKTDLSDWENQKSVYLAAHPGDLPYVNRILKAVATNDSKAFAGFQDENDKLSKKDDRSSALASERDALLGSATKAANATTGTSAAKQIDFFVSMDQSTWIARHVSYLERETARLELVRLRRPEVANNAQLVRYIEGLQRQRAQTLGVAAQYERSLVLAKFLEVIHQKTDHGGSAPATAEYVTARAELDAVLAQIDARRTRVLGDAKPPPPPPITPLKNVTMVRASAQSIRDSQAEGWIDGPGKDAPDYVVILKEAP